MSSERWKIGDEAVIKKGYLGEGTVLLVLGPVIYYGQPWVPVINSAEGEDPTFFKEAGLKKKV